MHFNPSKINLHVCESSGRLSYKSKGKSIQAAPPNTASAMMRCEHHYAVVVHAKQRKVHLVRPCKFSSSEPTSNASERPGQWWWGAVQLFIT
jgi:hypothetical protein